MTTPRAEMVGDFFERAPELFQKANRRQWELYEETLYGMRRPVTHGNFHAIRRFIGGYNAPIAAFRDARVHPELDAILRGAVYPDASAITLLDSFADGSSELASALLHFNQPAYPIYDASSVGALQRIGFSGLRWARTIEEDTVSEYQNFIDAVQGLKDTIPYTSVPEKNYYLTRIVQLSLWMDGLEHPAAEALGRPRPTLR